MNYSYKKHLIPSQASILTALAQLNELAADAILFVVDDRDTLLGSLTDGDVRRGLLRGLALEDPVTRFIQSDPKCIRRGHYDIHSVIRFRENNFRVIPVVDEDKRMVNVINFRFFKSYLPIDAVIMAGGRGERLKPLTDSTPKPLLPVGNKPIIEHNIDRLALYGVDDLWISINYLGQQLVDYLGDGKQRNITIEYVEEEKPLGTIGAVSNITGFNHDYVLIMNSDILTNIDYEHFFLDFVESNADLAVVTIPYQVGIPYAVVETENGLITGFKEKPTYTYYSNGGIYLMSRKTLNLIPRNDFFNATDLMEAVIATGGKVHSYPLSGYWLDIGKHEDYTKAQNDIKYLKF